MSVNKKFKTDEKLRELRLHLANWKSKFNLGFSKPQNDMEEVMFGHIEDQQDMQGSVNWDKI